MYKKIALFLSVIAMTIAHANVASACALGFLEEVETPEFLIK